MTPQPIIDALSALVATADEVTTARALKDQTTTALTTAQTADTEAGTILSDKEAAQQSALNSLVALLEQTYGKEQVEEAVSSLRLQFAPAKRPGPGAARGIFSKVDWAKLLPLLLKILTSIAGATPGATGTPGGTQASPRK